MTNASSTIPSGNRISRASLGDTWTVLKDVVLPTLGKGPLIRRRKVVGMAERFGLDDKAVQSLQALRSKYGPGPLMLRIPFRHQAVLLSQGDVKLVLEGSPDPFTAASREKQSALGHFEPDNVLATRGALREQRRDLNEKTLETGCPVHSMAAVFSRVIAEEMDAVAEQALAEGCLDWDGFFTGWFRMIRRIVLGDAARDDTELTDMLEKLRYRGNYAFMRSKDHKTRDAVLARLNDYVRNGDPQSLAGRMGSMAVRPGDQPHHQLPQYLFAFDPGAMASFRTLALLATHPAAMSHVQAELQRTRNEPSPTLDVLRSCYLEALRLWPTTPAILRETIRDVAWAGDTMKKATGVLIFTPFFHRDDQHLPDAHVFAPERWLGRVERPEDALVPFSHGPVVCPAALFVPMVATLAMRRLLERMTMSLNMPERLNPQRLPGTLDNFTLDFAVARNS